MDGWKKPFETTDLDQGSIFSKYYNNARMTKEKPSISPLKTHYFHQQINAYLKSRFSAVVLVQVVSQM